MALTAQEVPPKVIVRPLNGGGWKKKQNKDLCSLWRSCCFRSERTISWSLTLGQTQGLRLENVKFYSYRWLLQRMKTGNKTKKTSLIRGANVKMNCLLSNPGSSVHLRLGHQISVKTREAASIRWPEIPKAAPFFIMKFFFIPVLIKKAARWQISIVTSEILILAWAREKKSTTSLSTTPLQAAFLTFSCRPQGHVYRRLSLPN